MPRRRQASRPARELVALPPNAVLPGLSPIEPPQGRKRSRTTNEVRRELVANSKEERASKRAKFLADRTDRPRFPGQSILEQEAIAEVSAPDYRQEAREFLEYRIRQRLAFRTNRQKVEAVISYLNHGFTEGWDYAKASKAFSVLKEALPQVSVASTGLWERARRCLRGWQRLDPGCTLPPLAWELLALIVMTILEYDGGALRHEAALALLTMFACYFRPTEGTEIREEDLALSLTNEDHHALNLHPGHRAEQSKVGLSDETIALDCKELPQLGAALAHLRQGKPKQRLFRISKDQLRAYWKRALLRLGLQHLKLQLYSIRHCGPSHDRRRKYRSVAEVKRRGRWASDKSMARYEAHARVVQEFQKLSVDIQTRARAAVKRVKEYVELQARGGW